MRKKTTAFTISIIATMLISTLGCAQQVSAHTTTYTEGVARIKQLEDEHDNLDKQLGVFIAAPREVDLGDSIQVVAAGVRLGKAVFVEPTKVEITLEDQQGFRMAFREWRPNGNDTDPDLWVVEPYTRLFWASFPAIETAGIFNVRVDMSYIAPWGDEISGSATQEISCQSWFNISSLLEGQRQATKQTLNTVLGNASEIVRAVAAQVKGVADGIGDIIDFVDDMAKVGTIDPASMRFFVPYITGWRTDADLGARQSADGTDLDPAANYQDFVDSLDVLAQAGLPFEVYIIEDEDQLNTYHEGKNASYAAIPVSTENVDDPGYFLAYEPGVTTWVSGRGSSTAGDEKFWDLEDPLPYRNILLNLYENWFPISNQWNDYTGTYNRSTQFTVTEGFAPWTARRWVKAIAVGMDRNYSLFYNIKGEPMQNFFNIDGVSDITNAGGFDMLNDFCIYTQNFSVDSLTLDPNVQQYLGGKLDVNTVRDPYRNSPQGMPVVIEGQVVDKGGASDWIGVSLFNRGMYPQAQYINDEGFTIRNQFLQLGEYGDNVYYSAGVGMLLSPGLGFGYSSIENVTMGFELLHGMYYKIVGDAVQVGLDKLLTGAAGMQADKPQIADEMIVFYDELYQAWYGDGSGTLAMDLEEVNRIFTKINELTMPTLNLTTGEPELGAWTTESFDFMEEKMGFMQNVSETAFNDSVALDDALAQAGSDINFGFFGDLFGSIGGFFGNIGGAILNGLGWIGSGLGWLGGAVGLGNIIPGYPSQDEWVGNMNENAENIGENVDEAVDEALNIFNLIKDQVLSLISSVVKSMLSSLVGSITGNFDLVNDLIDGINTFKDQVASAINSTLVIIQDLVEAMAQALEDIANTIDEIKDFLNDFVDLAFEFIINQTETIQATMQNIKTEVLQSTGFYYQIKDSMFKQVEKSEFASGLLNYAAQQAPKVTDEIFFKELDVLQPIALLQSGDNGLYVVQLGNEALDEIILVTMHKGELVNVDSINATYQVLSTSPIGMQVEQAFDSEHGLATGIYIADFQLATERDWMTKFDIEYFDPDEGKLKEAFIVERTTKIVPSLQPDAYPDIIFDPSAVQLSTGENYILHIGIDNLMFSKPNVTVRTELIGTLGILVGLREEIIELNEEGEDPVFIDLEANIPFYVPPGTYQLIVKIVEDNGDVTRVVHNVEVTAENFLFGLIGGLLALLGIGVAMQKKRMGRKRGSGITVARSGRLLQGCSLKDAKAGKCTMVVCDDLGNCSI